MAVPTRYTDGSQPYGSVTLTIDTVAYIANTFTVTRPTTDVMDYDVNGLPQRRRSTAGLSEFTAELQLATSSTGLPQYGDTFSTTIDANYGAETFVIDSVVPNYSNDAGAIRTVTISGKKVINSITTI